MNLKLLKVGLTCFLVASAIFFRIGQFIAEKRLSKEYSTERFNQLKRQNDSLKVEIARLDSAYKIH